MGLTYKTWEQDGQWTAQLGERQIAGVASTEKGAIEVLLTYVAELASRGCLDETGVPADKFDLAEKLRALIKVREPIASAMRFGKARACEFAYLCGLRDALEMISRESQDPWGSYPR